MPHNEQEHKGTGQGGPQAHPSNQTPSKRAGGGRGRNGGRSGGNKVTQGKGSDTGNKGKQ
jgi:hypothetical protein